MDLSLTTDLDDSFLNDWGDDTKQEPTTPESVEDTKKKNVDRVKTSNQSNDNDFVKDLLSGHVKKNGIGNTDQLNNHHQFAALMNSLMEGNNNVGGLQASQEMQPQSVPVSFWPMIANVHQNQSIRNKIRNENVNLDYSPVHGGNSMLNQWNQQDLSVNHTTNTSSKQNHATSNTQKIANDAMNSDKNSSLYQIQNNSTSNVAQHQSHNLSPIPSQQNNTTLNNNNLWQSNEISNSTQQIQVTSGQHQQQAQVQRNQVAVTHPIYSLPQSNIERSKAHIQHQAEIYQNAAVSILKGQQQIASQQGNSVNTNGDKIQGPNNTLNNTTSSIQQTQDNTNRRNTNNITTVTGVATSQPQQQTPPFHLFGAPCELRYNFIQSQKQHDLPIWQDNNSYHYGMSINGFHPQLNAMENPPVLIDTRHTIMQAGGRNERGNDVNQRASSCKERNEKEQRRAQKITELIERLRLSMVDGGWKVEMKSKFHILSTCKDYVEHLIKTTQEKEQALEKAKSDLMEKQKKQQEDKAANESRSDPESVMSSLTASSRNTSSNSSSASIDDSDGKAKKENEDMKKRKLAYENNGKVGRQKVETHQKSSVDANVHERSEQENTKQEKSNKVETDHNENKSEITQASSSENDKDKKKCQEIENTQTKQVSESEIDDNNKASDVSTLEDSSINVSELTKQASEDMVLDYEQVFMSSNVPQLIATAAGRIVKYNDFFLNAVGLTAYEMRHLTIFSIVQADQLSNLFETLGKALHSLSFLSSDTSSDTANESNNDSERTDTEETVKSNTTQHSNFSLISLPCIPFPCEKKRMNTTNDLKNENNFVMTISLLGDQDPQKCLFHCLLSRCSNKNKSKQYITPKIVSSNENVRKIPDKNTAITC